MKLSGVGRTWADGGAWSSTPEHFVAEAVFLYNMFNAIGFAVRRRSDLGRRKGVVVHSLDDHSQKEGDHRQSPWLRLCSFTIYSMQFASPTNGSMDTFPNCGVPRPKI